MAKEDFDKSPFGLPDFRELDRKEMLEIVNECLQELRKHQFSTYQIEDEAPLLTVAENLAALIISGRVSIDGKPLVIIKREK